MIKIKKILLISLSCVLFGSAVGCKEVKDSDVGHVNEHTTHRYRMEVVEPTSNEEGYTIYTCICGDSYIGEYIDINEEVFLQAVEKGGICAVDKNIELDSAVYITKNLVVDLMANISMPNDTIGDGAFCVKSGTLTLNGNGTVNAVGDNDYCLALWADGGKIVINGGIYTNEGAGEHDQYDLLYVKNGGIIEINGGEFKCQTPEWTLNSHDSKVGTIVIKGGKFYKFNPTELPANLANDNITVAEGYMVVQNGDWYEVVKA